MSTTTTTPATATHPSWWDPENCTVNASADVFPRHESSDVEAPIGDNGHGLACVIGTALYAAPGSALSRVFLSPLSPEGVDVTPDDLMALAVHPVRVAATYQRQVDSAVSALTIPDLESIASAEGAPVSEIYRRIEGPAGEDVLLWLADATIGDVTEVRDVDKRLAALGQQVDGLSFDERLVIDRFLMGMGRPHGHGVRAARVTLTHENARPS